MGAGRVRNPTSADIPRQTVCALAVVVAQLVERSLPTPEIRGSKPVIGKFYIIYMLSTGLKRQKKKKRSIKKQIHRQFHLGVNVTNKF